MSRTARFAAVAAVFAALCAGAVTTASVAAAAESHHIGASADGSINWDTAPASLADSINWD
ncbi:hypothetical protein PV721_26520 [Streptomyces sp. MB09-01]|uniref:hypothetical protein n=1 Tax=Streptomyces sp. MB09-01 TaxID=3028666 RepID=UPI0029A46F89|nr:hypothetical protein [Streptomyces sp. MB09-01]MDX3537852.1 hypothetical protein [Streptomyces sp. MB09-01]